MATDHIAIHASEGPALRSYLLEETTGKLLPVGEITLPQNVQYGWYHPNGLYLYVASSDGGPRRAGENHSLSTLEICTEDGSLSYVSEPQPLPARAVSICLDRDSRNVVALSNEPTGLSRSAVDFSGRAQAGSPQPVADALGSFPHQVRVVPGGELLVVVARGYPEGVMHGPTPGSIRLFRQVAGKLELAGVVAPNGGAGFGARNLDFHPTLPMAYVGLETESRLLAFPLAEGHIASSAIADLPTLESPAVASQRQIGGSVKVHPDGRFVYAINRADGTDAAGTFSGGENSIAVFRIDASGAPSQVAHVPTGGIHARTFAIDRSGHWMVVANMKPRRLTDGKIVPPSLATFRIGEDGVPLPCIVHALPFDDVDLTNTYTPQSGSRSVFWMGVSSVSSQPDNLNAHPMFTYETEDQCHA